MTLAVPFVLRHQVGPHPSRTGSAMKFVTVGSILALAAAEPKYRVPLVRMDVC